jgi:hypothetical protein
VAGILLDTPHGGGQPPNGVLQAARRDIENESRSSWPTAIVKTPWRHVSGPPGAAGRYLLRTTSRG